MSKNALFNLIRIRKKIAKFDLPNDIKLIERTHKSGSQYFLFELPIEKDYVIGQYHLISHHVSVYEKPLGRLDLKSQYHYTAYFDHEGDTYRLHVYYDADDDYVSKPLFSKMFSEDDFIPVDCSENAAAFDLLSDSATKNLIDCLRAAQASHIKTLTMQYDELEASLLLLSEDIYKHKANYISTLQSQIDVLNELERYTTDPRWVARKIKWLTTSLKHIELLEPPKNSSPTNERSKPEGKDKADASDKNSNLSRKPRGHQLTYFKDQPTAKPSAAAKVIHKIKPDFSTVIEKLSQKFEAYVKLKDTVLIDLIQSLYSELSEVEWALEFTHKYNVAFNDLKNLKIIRTKIEEMGVGLLQRTLVAGNFIEAVKLGTFYNLMPTSIACLALHCNNTQLLDFLLKNKIIPINFKKFIIGKVEYTSMVEYCFNNTTTEKNLEPLLSVLVKNGASLLDVDRTSGLPYAAILLLKPKHPLHAVLDKNANLTLNSPMFYKQLNQVLFVISSKTACSIELKSQVKELISSNLTRIELLKHRVIIADDNKASECLEETLGEEMMRQVIEDPDIQFYKLKIERQIALLLPRLPLKQRKCFAKITSLNFEIVCNAVNRIQSFDEVPSFDEIKEETLTQQRYILEFINLRDELVDVHNKLRGVHLHHHKPSREQKKIIVREKAIIQRMEEIQDLLTEPYASINSMRDSASGIFSEMNQFVGMAKYLLDNNVLSKADDAELDNQIGGLFLLTLMKKALETNTSNNAIVITTGYPADNDHQHNDDSDEDSKEVAECTIQ
jgi:hypothetical protein